MTELTAQPPDLSTAREASPAVPMPSGRSGPPVTEYALSPALRVVVGLLLLAMVPIFWHTAAYIYSAWQVEENSHGMLIPFISAMMLYQRRRELQQTRFAGSWAGVAIALAGVAMYFVGTLALIPKVDAYSLIVVIAGVFLAVTGWAAFRIALPALALLLLMNPVPSFLFYSLSSALQLISSQIGVAVIRLFDISAFVEGNVIDLGTYKLQVVEACSGLRYLFPLLTLGVMVATIVRFPMWIRVMLVASTIPITILMNSFRIGMIGVLVDRHGIAQAEGFLHDFEGWVIFMTCFALLLLEVWLLLRLRGDRRAFRDILAIEWPTPRSKQTPVQQRKVPVPAMAATGLIALTALAALLLPQRTELVPERSDFTQYPLQIGEWQGRRGSIDNASLDVLQLDDYILADYANGVSQPVNFYIAYYTSQRSGRAVHSPAMCLPGGGWQMSDFAPHVVTGVTGEVAPLQVNRVIITQGDQRQLVYYWFKQRDRNISSELMVKWYMVWDSLLRNRSDGALVRLVTPLGKGEAIEKADARLTGFLRQTTPTLAAYVPD